jgi:hypothetical protein
MDLILIIIVVVLLFGGVVVAVTGERGRFALDPTARRPPLTRSLTFSR